MTHPHADNPNYKCILYFESLLAGGGWDRLYQACLRSKVFGHLRFCEDLKSEVWAATYRKMIEVPSAVYDPAKGPMLHWVLHIAEGQQYNLIRNHHQKNRVVGSVSAYDEAVSERVPAMRWGENATPEQQAIAKEGIETLSSMDIPRWARKIAKEYKITTSHTSTQTLSLVRRVVEGSGRSTGGRTNEYIDRITLEGNR